MLLGKTKEAQELGHANVMPRKTAFTEWVKSIWEMRYCWVDCWGRMGLYGQISDMLNHTIAIELRKLTFLRLSEKQSITILKEMKK